MGWVRARSDWMLVEEDECWFSRFAQPRLKAWAEEGEALGLWERSPEQDESEPQALACYGAVRDDSGQVYLYFCGGQPNSEHSMVMLRWLVEIARREGKRVVVVIWDQASWHKSKAVAKWVREHNRRAKQEGDVRLLVWRLPTKSPWLNSMEPRWMQAKKAVAEPDGRLSATELKRRLCAHFQTEPHVPIPNKSFKESLVE